MSSVFQIMPERVNVKEQKGTQKTTEASETSDKCFTAAEDCELTNGLKLIPDEKPPLWQKPAEFGLNLKIIKMNDQVRELQTILRDR